MSNIRKLCSTSRAVGREVETAWSWHHRQMSSNARYAGTLVQGIARALWQPSVRRYVLVLATVIVEILKILREDRFTPPDDFDA